jgi:aminoglycoside phosphotransferase (APT) family kinase protein
MTSRADAGAPLIVDTHEDAARLSRRPLLVLRPLEAVLDKCGFGGGPLRAQLIGEGHSNVTFLLEREGRRAVLRRPAYPPERSARDVLREARILRLLGPTPARAPKVLLACDDRSLLGAPFYVMEHVAGTVIAPSIPDTLDDDIGRNAVADELVDALVELHSVDITAPGLAAIGHPDGFLDRQLRTWTAIWRAHRTRDLPVVEEVAAWLAARRPRPRRPAIVHGDYRLGNMIFAPAAPARLISILDWEIATIGDPLCDVGWMLANWPEPGHESGTLLAMAGTVAEGGFPARAELVARYAERSGRAVGDIRWYVVLAFWRAAIGLETLHARSLTGTPDDPFVHELEVGVPELADRARTAAAEATERF